MKKFGFIAAAVVFVFALGVTAFGQTTPSTKIGWIDTGAFSDEKTGIVKYVNAYKALSTEVKPRETELVGLQTRIQNIAKELQTPPPAGVPVNQQAMATKREEGERLTRELEFKKKEYDAFVQKRGGEILGPLNADIGKAIADFGKQKGYIAIFDIEKLAQAGAILHLEPTADITKDFIAFYNARPAAATASAAPPK